MNRNRPPQPWFLSILTLLSLALAAGVEAATNIWDADLGTPNPQDGGGAWSMGTGGWWRGGSNVNWTASDQAVFGAGVDGSYAVLVSGNVTNVSGNNVTGGLNFTNSGYTLSGTNPVTVFIGSGTSTAVIKVSTNKTATIGTNVTVQKFLAAQTSLLGGGTLVIDSGGVLRNPNTGNLNEVANGSTLRVTGGTVSFGSSLVLGQFTTGWGLGGSLLMDAGTLTVSNNNVIVGRTAGDVANFTLNAGTVSLNTTAAGAGVGHLRSDNGAATVTLNGGTLTTRQVYGTTGAGRTFDLIFNGGALQASPTAVASQRGNFISNLTSVTIQGNGAVIDPNGLSLSISQALLAGTGSGGLTLNDTAATKGTLTLSGANTYTGPTTINAGTLVVPAPYNALGSPVVNNGGKLKVTVGASASSFGSLTLNDGARTEFDLGDFNAANAPGLALTTLVIPNGTTNYVDISGLNIPVTNITLLTYGSQSGTGLFALGTLPTAMSATLTNTGSALVLQVTSPSASLFTWSAGTGDWDIGTSMNWNGGSAAYSQAQPAVVVFPDNASGTVTVTTNVSPLDMDVIITNVGFYTFSGPGSINGSTGIDIFGNNTVTLANSNAFTGVVTVGGGIAYVTVANPYALGSTSGGTIVNGPSNTLALGTFFGPGVTVSGETVSISGTGIGGTRGALRGSAVAVGETNVWAGPVVLAANGARIGAEDGGNLVVTGTITDNGTNFGPTIRPGSGATVVIGGAGNTWGGTTTLFGSDSSSTVKAGANNPFATNAILAIGTCTADLNGFNQTCAGVALASSGVPASTILVNNAAVLSTLTINGTNDSSFSGDVTGNLAFVKNGTNTQTLTGANLTYTGNTTVTAGRLNITTPTTMSSSVGVSADAALGGEFTTTGTLTLSPGSTLYVDPLTPASISASAVTASSATVRVGFVAAPPAGIPVLVLASTAAIAGSAGNFEEIGVRGGSFYLTNSDTELYFVADAATSLTWKGTDSVNPTFWDVLVTTNWDKGGTPDAFFTGDAVRFDDSAATNAVAIQGSAVTPSSVVVSNDVLAYTFGGGALGGATSLLKQGTNTLTLTAANSYTGGTIISGGTVLISADSRLGTVPTVPTPSNVVLNAGTLTMTVANLNLNSNRTIYVGASGGTLGNVSAGNWTLPNTIEGPGLLTLDSIVSGANFLLGAQNTFASGLVITGQPGSYVYPIVSSVGDPGSLVSGPFGTGPVTFKGPGTRSTTASATTVGNAVTFAADVAFQTVGSEKTLTFSGPVTLAGGDRTLAVSVGATVPTESLIFAGPIGEASAGLGLIKTAAGQMTVAGTNSYSGGTTISNGLLVLSATGLLTNSPVLRVITPGRLDVSAAPFTLLTYQTLQGNGAVVGDVLANGTLEPGSSVGTLTFSNNLTIAGDLVFELDKSLTASNDLIRVVGPVLTNVGDGTLIVSNLGPALVVGDTFKLFSQAVGNGSALAIAGPAGVTFTNKLEVDGSIAVLVAPPTVPTTPTNITYSVTSSNITLGWPAEYTGWYLQSQTNSLNVGLSSNWTDVAGSETTNSVTLPVSVFDPAVFFRMVHTNTP